MYAFGVCEPRVVTVVSCILKAGYLVTATLQLPVYRFVSRNQAKLVVLLQF